MYTWYFTKETKLYSRKNKASSANGTGLTGCQQVEECEQIYVQDTAQKSNLSGSQYKARYTEPDRR